MVERAQAPTVVDQRSFLDRLRAPATAGAALLLYALLIDAAVETWQSASPVRMWVTGPVALYVAYTLWLLRQPSANRPPARASMWLSLFLVLAVLALTASMPGGLTTGMRVAGQDTSRVLVAANVAVILLALASFAFSGSLPLVLRALGAAGAIYAIVSFGIGAAHGNDYVQMLRGHAFYEGLPYWLQGSFVGALVVVPLAFVVEVVVALAVLRVRGRLHRLVAFALAALIAYYACAGGAG
jgi:hypothetical protein